MPDPAALEIILAGADRVVQVSETEIRDAIRAYFVDTHNVAEGASAAALAGLLKEKAALRGRKAGVIHSGGNIDAALLAGIL